MNASAMLRRAMLRRAIVATLSLALGACSWFTDFKQQPSVNALARSDVSGMGTMPSVVAVPLPAPERPWQTCLLYTSDAADE